MDDKQITEFLTQTEVFQYLTPQSLGSIGSKFKEETLSADSIIFKKGDVSDSLVFIIEGEIEVKDGDNLIATLSQFSVVGEMGVFTNRSRSADVIAKRETSVLRIKKEDFLNIMFDNRDLGIRVMQNVIILLSERLRQNNKK